MRRPAPSTISAMCRTLEYLLVKARESRRGDGARIEGRGPLLRRFRSQRGNSRALDAELPERFAHLRERQDLLDPLHEFFHRAEAGGRSQFIVMGARRR